MNMIKQGAFGASIVAAGLLVAASAAQAGGFAIREQSTSFLGSAFAGNAAGGDLSSSFWNSAALGLVPGTNSESHATLILPDSSITVLPGTSTGVGTIGETVDVGVDAFVGASYFGHQLGPNMTIGVAMNSPFGLVTEPDNRNWAGQYQARTAKLTTVNLNPMVAYRVMPNFIVGVGAQIEWAKLKLKVNPSTSIPNQDSSVLSGEDVAVGFTAGVIFMPMQGTTIGVGFRSSVGHTLEGEAFVVGNTVTTSPLGGKNFTPIGIKADLDTPEVVTLSLRQDLTPTIRVMGTVEWTNWSRLSTIPVYATSTGALMGLGAPGTKGPGDVLQVLEFNWDDGWFYSVGGEYDLMPNLTIRGGVAYEESPVQKATSRSLAVPDTNRWWLSGGATYRYSDSTTLDFAYAHIFLDKGAIDRTTTINGSLTGLGIGDIENNVVGEVDTSIDIVSVSLKTKWGAPPEPLK